MTIKADRENRARVKLALADKYENLANTISSRPRQASYLRHVARFRRQAADLRNLNKSRSHLPNGTIAVNVA